MTTVRDRTFVSMVDRIMPHVPGCPRETVRRYVRDAAIQVCERTLFWRYEIPLFELQPGVSEYFFNTRSGADVHAVFLATVNGNPLNLLNLDEAVRLYPAWAEFLSGETASTLWSESTHSGSFNTETWNEPEFNSTSSFTLPDSVVASASYPQALTQLTPEKYLILPLPDGQATYEVRMLVALKPKRDATGMDEFVANELEDVILHRVVQNLTLLPNVPWSNKDLATYHARQYQFHMNERRARANLGNARGGMVVQMQPWA